MTEQKCDTGYHLPYKGTALFKCVLMEGHAGPHDDGSGNKSMVIEESSEMNRIDREIKAGLAGSDRKPLR